MKLKITGGGDAVGLSPILRAALEPAIGVHNISTGKSVRVNRLGHRVTE